MDIRRCIKRLKVIGAVRSAFRNRFNMIYFPAQNGFLAIRLEINHIPEQVTPEFGGIFSIYRLRFVPNVRDDFFVKGATGNISVTLSGLWFPQLNYKKLFKYSKCPHNKTIFTSLFPEAIVYIVIKQRQLKQKIVKTFILCIYRLFLYNSHRSRIFVYVNWYKIYKAWWINKKIQKRLNVPKSI